MLTDPFTEAVAEAEKLIANAPHVTTDRDLAEGYDYLAGSIRASLQMAWAYERDYPFFVRSTDQHTKLGLDNPDTLYFHAYLRDDAEYVVTGVRGSTADLSFQVLDGNYTPTHSPGSLTAFDDREIRTDENGDFELRFGPEPAGGRTNYRTLAPGSAMLVVREAFDDWSTEQPGRLRIHRADTLGTAPAPPSNDRMSTRYEVAGKILLSRLKTFLAFPEWHYLSLPVNTMTTPRPTPGGLATQFSSVGHFDLDEDQAMVITVPAANPEVAPYQGFQLGSMWYVSLDYQHHQTSLTRAQSTVDPDGAIRYVVSDRNPGLANWIERTGHRRGYLQIRWQRLSRDLTEADGPTVEIVGVDDLPRHLPFHDRQRITPEQWATRIATRQTAVAARMLG